jgi:hypothetical protein
MAAGYCAGEDAGGKSRGNNEDQPSVGHLAIVAHSPEVCRYPARTWLAYPTTMPLFGDDGCTVSWSMP